MSDSDHFVSKTMTRQEAKRALRDFSIEYAPTCLKDAGGCLSKTRLHAFLEEEFRKTSGCWPPVLSEKDEAGHRHAANAIAWALSLLTRRNVIYPVTGTNFVEIRDTRGKSSSNRPGHRAKTKTFGDPNSCSGRPAIKPGSAEAQLERVVRARARSAMQRAVKAGIPYDESFVEDSIDTLRRQEYCCALSGIRFDVEFRTPGAGGTHFAPSPDRLKADHGYTKRNVRWVLWCINRGKGELDMNMFIQICRKIAENN